MENLNNDNYKDELLEPFISEYGKDFIKEFIPFLFSVQNNYLSYALGNEEDALKLNSIIQFFLNLYKEETDNIESIESQIKDKDDNIKHLEMRIIHKDDIIKTLKEGNNIMSSVLDTQTKDLKGRLTKN